MRRVNILNVNISAINMEDCIKYIIENFNQTRGTYICAANVHTTVYAKENKEYRTIQNNSFLTLPDGKPLSVIGKRKGFTSMDRVTGPDFLEKILEISDQHNWTHFFYGNTDENLELVINYIMDHYPNINIVGYKPSVFRKLSIDEENELVEKINERKPDFVWVGLGAPIQEELCSRLSKKTKSLWIGVGGAFNVIAGIIPRAPQWMQKNCLEWLYRFLKEPKRLFKRYLVTNTKFIYYLIISKISEKEE